MYCPDVLKLKECYQIAKENKKFNCILISVMYVCGALFAINNNIITITMVFRIDVPYSY